MTLIETPRLIMRVLEPQDREWIFRLVGGEDWIRNIGDRGMHSLVNADAYIERVRASHERNGFSFYAVVLRNAGSTGASSTGASSGEGIGIGICGLTKREELALPDVGFAFLPEYYNKGYAFEAASAVLEHGRSTLGLQAVGAIVSPANAASIRVIEKLGLRPDESLRSEATSAGQSGGETLYYSRRL